MAKEQIPDFKARTRLSAGHLNKLVRHARQEITGTPPILVNTSGNNINLSLGNIPNKWWVGEVQDSDASGSDYSDCHYIVKKQYIDSTINDLVFSDNTFPSDKFYLVTNLPEFIGNTHTLDEDTIVIVYELKDADGSTRYIMAEGGAATSVKFGKLLSDYTGDTTLMLRKCNENGDYLNADSDKNHVLVYTSPDGDDATTIIGTYWRLDGPILRYVPHVKDDTDVEGVLVGVLPGVPVDTGIYKVLQLNTDNEASWDFLRGGA